MSDVAERVASGVAWLDTNQPGWAEQIDLSEFNIRAGCYCVLGQVYGNYWDAPLIVKEDEFDSLGDETQARALGFQAAIVMGDARIEEFHELQGEWIRIIQERQSVPPDGAPGRETCSDCLEPLDDHCADCGECSCTCEDKAL